jgi:glutamyl-tRNA reductase
VSSGPEIVLSGLSHHTAPVEVREKVLFGRETLADALGRLRSLLGVEEGLILSTCNRTEVLTRCMDVAEARRGLQEFLRVESRLDAAVLQGCLYNLEGMDAVRHLFRVTASLDSQVVGEPQILHQVKEAHAEALRQGAIGPMLDALCQRAFAAARRVRRDTDIGRHPVSISYAAAELARTIFGDLAGRLVLVIGAGRMAELAVKHLSSAGVGAVYVCSRTHDHAAALSDRVGGEAVPFERLGEYLQRVDIVVSSTSAPSYILGAAEVAGLIRRRRSRPIFFIDIAMPRDIDPAVNEIDNVYLYDLDDLRGVVAENTQERHREAVRAEALIAEAVDGFRRWHLGLSAGPTIVDLRSRLHGLREQELSRLASRCSLSAEQTAAVDEFSRLLVNKILHRPTSELKRLAGGDERAGQVDTVRRLFGLDAAPEPVREDAGRRTEPGEGSGERTGRGRGPAA